MHCSGGVCAPTAKNAILNASELAAMLATADVKVVTGNGAVTITVSSPFSWSSTQHLTLDANLNVSFRAAVTLAGAGGLAIVTDDGGSGGDLMFFPGGKVDFMDLDGSLAIGGQSYTLVDDLAGLAAGISAEPSGFYALAKDYDAAPDGTYTLPPVQTNLTGTVEGLGHAISNFSIDVTQRNKPNVGVFATSSGTLRDIDVVNADVQASPDGMTVGALQGSGNGTIVACSATGTVHTGGFTTQTGGLAGSAGTIIRSHADVTVEGGDGDSGGLVGLAFAVSQSYATGDVSDAAAGGLAATNDGSIEFSHATGQVTARDYVGGGLVANNSGHVSQSYATGSVSGGEWAGGLVGASDADVINSYSTGRVDGGNEARVGGLIGQSTGGIAVNTSYSVGFVHGHPRRGGGFIGRTESTPFKNDYWDVTTSAKSDGWGRCQHTKGNCQRDIVGLTDDQLKSALPAGFNPAIWGQDPSINDGYPYLLANPPM